MSALQVVYELLLKMEKSAYSNIALSSALNSSALSPQDKRLVSRLFYGVIERKLTLDHVVSKYSKKSPDKLDIEVLIVLRIGLYQLLYMDKIPDNAAVNGSVELVKANRKSSASGFVNAVLRGFIRDGKRIEFPSDRIERLSVENSCPVWLVKKLISEYGEENAVSLIRLDSGPPPIAIRVNTTLTESEKLVKRLADEGVTADICSILPNCLLIHGTGNVEQLSAFKEGLFHVQDLSSQLCAEALGAVSGDVVLDMCSAPGGKSFTIAEIMGNKGSLFAYELHKKRADLVAEGAARLKLDIIKAAENNASVYSDNIPTADKILCDVPCSGLGVIRRKPEIKYKKESDLERLPEIQLSILETSAKYLREGGELIYSTCSVSRSENDEVVDKFLERNPQFMELSFLENMGKPFGKGRVTVFPKDFGSDGFFICKFRKK